MKAVFFALALYLAGGACLIWANDTFYRIVLLDLGRQLEPTLGHLDCRTLSGP